MPKLSLSLAQMQVIPGDNARNIATAQRMVAEAARRKSSLIVFPELFTTGYVLNRAKEFASELNKGDFAELAGLATKGNIAITPKVSGKIKMLTPSAKNFFGMSRTLIRYLTFTVTRARYPCARRRQTWG